jgi:hypothetical protein
MSVAIPSVTTEQMAATPAATALAFSTPGGKSPMPVFAGAVAVVAAVEWGPVGSWVGGIAAFLAAMIALLVSKGDFERFRAPRLRLSFQSREPWCRPGRGPVRW